VNTPDDVADWQKSSHSGNNADGNCVEVGVADHRGGTGAMN
jgi:Domain of unknown function (DUF397)